MKTYRPNRRTHRLYLRRRLLRYQFGRVLHSEADMHYARDYGRGLVEIVCEHLVAELADAGVSNPLSQPVTLAAVIADLSRLAGACVPGDVAALVG